MNRIEFAEWFDAEVRSRWPNWRVNSCIVGDWFTALHRYDVTVLTEVVRQHKIRDDPARPRIKQVHALARTRAIADRPATPQQETNVFIECLKAPPGRPNLVGLRKGVYVYPPARQSDADYVRAAAEWMCRRHEEIYGGHWISVVTQPPTDDGLRGEPARRKAYENILNGPDTPGKRWLQRYLGRKSDPDASPLLGDVIRLGSSLFS